MHTHTSNQHQLAKRKSRDEPRATRRVDRATQTKEARQRNLATVQRSQTIQAKLTIGQPNDVYEQEADRVPELVMNQSNKSIQERNAPFQISHKSNMSSGEVNIPRQLENQINSLKGKGQPLPDSTRTFFEPNFGDLSQVNVHTDAKAEKCAKELNARAFTAGHSIMFGSGQYSPESETGKKLLAHELTHVVQQDVQHHIENPVVMCKTYGNKEFSFDMQEDGRIVVKKDDWLSKYSAAMYDGDTTRIYEFIRYAKNYIIPIENKDIIKEGEVIYHIITLLEYISGKNPASHETPIILVPKNIPVGKYKGPREGLRAPEPRPFEKPKKSEKPYKVPSMLRGKPPNETQGERNIREKEEMERRRGGSPDLPGTIEPKIDSETLKKLHPKIRMLLEE